MVTCIKVCKEGRHVEARRVPDAVIWRCASKSTSHVDWRPPVFRVSGLGSAPVTPRLVRGGHFLKSEMPLCIYLMSTGALLGLRIQGLGFQI